MKTSNKLLIALAISLIVIPIIVIAVNVKMNYTDKGVAVNKNKNEEHFNTPSEGYISEKISSSFSEVEIMDGKGLELDIVLVKDNNTGIKIAEEFKKLITYSVNNGKLQITFKGSVKQEFREAQLYIYAPGITSFAASKGNSLSLGLGNTDSLNLKATKIGAIWFNTELKFNKLLMSADSVGDIHFDKMSINSLNLNLKNTSFKTTSSSYRMLTISASGASNIEIDGDESKADKFFIDDLSLKTEGKSTVTLSNIKVNKTSGSLSDSTYVIMPASSLKQMFKN